MTESIPGGRVAPPAGSARDFDFLHGRWRVEHCRLKTRLAGSNDWEEFSGLCHCFPVLGGNGNVDDNILHLPSGSYRAVTLRSFDPVAGQWAIWWLDARHPHGLDVPVIGGFADGVGSFFADDSFNGRPVRVRFRWTVGPSPTWEQAFSDNGGASWEINWAMRFVADPEGNLQ